MKLLIFSFYYPPDLCAGSFRCGALVDALERAMPRGMSVEVITTQPNRYKGSIPGTKAIEQRGAIRVHRIELPDHDSGMMDQARAFGAFARQALSIARATGPHDAVFATSSRLMTAALGAWESRRSGAPLYLDIRDLFVETITDVVRDSRARLLLPGMKVIERATFGRADAINVVSPGFIEDMVRLAPKATLRTFSNGIDDEFLELSLNSSRAERTPLILYAGNIGEGQGLHEIVPQAARMLAGRARFRIVGHGGRAVQLANATRGLDNVEIVPPVPRARLLEEYANADILLLHLNDVPAFLKVLPSKLFEYGALGRPILAGLAGVSADFLRSELSDAVLFAPCDVEGLVRGYEQLRTVIQIPDRSEFKQRFARRRIMDQMAADLVAFTRRAAKG